MITASATRSAGDEIAPIGEHAVGSETERYCGPLTMPRSRFGDLHDLDRAAVLGGECRDIRRSATTEADDGDAQRAIERHTRMLGEVRRCGDIGHHITLGVLQLVVVDVTRRTRRRR